MTEREYLLNATTGLLLIALLRHHPRSRAYLGTSGLLLLTAGSLIPLLDLLLGYLQAVDRIDFLALPPRLGGMVYGGAFIAATAFLAGCAAGGAWAAQTARLLTLGFLLSQVLLAITPVGAPLLEPYYSFRVSLPLFPGGHPLLLGLLTAGLILLEVWPRHSRRIVLGVIGLGGVYFLSGVLLYGLIFYKTLPLRDAGRVVHIYPGNVWLTKWVVIEEEPERYLFRVFEPLIENLPALTVMERWNDQAWMIRLLSDPIVRRFQNNVFRYPVVHVESTANQITLMMQEVENLSPMIPGRTFSLESDLLGRDRYYQVQRFE